MLNQIFTQEEISKILNIAKKAGDIILEYYHGFKDVSVVQKEDDSPVTKADLAANDLIIKELKKLFSEFPIVSEENEKADNAQAIKKEQYFIIDPLDGTSSFIKKSDEFTVNIAFIKGGKPAFGVIYLPVRDIIYYSDMHNDAYKIDHFSEGTSKIKKLKTANNGKNDLKVICTKREPEKSEIMADLESRNISIKEIKSISSSYKFCLIAEGLADLYLRKVHIKAWDVAAGHAIVNAAGGSMVDGNRKEIVYGLKDNFEMPFFEVF